MLRLIPTLILRLINERVKGKLADILKILSVTSVITGCSTLSNYRLQTSSFYNDYRTGLVSNAALTASSLANKKAESADALVWRLEEGSLLRADGKFQESNRAFSQAEEIIDDYDSRATISARGTGSHLASLVTNLKAIPYKGTAYDRIMLNTYKALNYMALGEFDGARVELLRAYERQKEALERYRRELEIAEEEAKSNNVDIGRITSDPRFKQQFDSTYSGYSSFSAYADYVNPLTVYLDGLLFFATASGSSDYERARKDFERVKGMIGNDPFVNADLSMVEKAINGEPIQPAVYVVFENGLAPARGEARLDIPVPTKEVTYIGAAFPTLNFQGTAIENLTITDDQGRIARTRLLSDMDTIVANEFSHNLDAIIIRTIMATVVKATAQYQLQKNFGSLGQIGGALYSIVTTQADLRSWISLPKQFQFARFPRPNSSHIYLTTSDATVPTKVDIPKSEITLIYAKAVEGPALSYVHSIKLR